MSNGTDDIKEIAELRPIVYKKQITSIEEAVKDYVQNYLKEGTYITGE